MEKKTVWIIVAVVAGIVVLGGGFWTLWVLPWMAFGALGWLFGAAFLLPSLLLALGVIGVGYLAFRARVAREEAPAQELMAGEDPADELAEINDELEALAEASAASLERTRETMEKGLRG